MTFSAVIILKGEENYGFFILKGEEKCGDCISIHYFALLNYGDCISNYGLCISITNQTLGKDVNRYDSFSLKLCAYFFVCQSVNQKRFLIDVII